MLVVSAACALPLLACGGGEPSASGVVSDSTYVEVMARLVLLDSTMTSPAEVPLGGLDRDSARRIVLRRHGVDADELLRFAEERGRSPEVMADVWRRVQELGDSLESSDWRPGAEAEPAARRDREAAPGPGDAPDSVPGTGDAPDSASGGARP